MFSLYMLGTLEKSNELFADFYEKSLYPEVKDRVPNKIAAVPDERCRMIDLSVTETLRLKKVAA